MGEVDTLLDQQLIALRQRPDGVDVTANGFDHFLIYLRARSIIRVLSKRIGAEEHRDVTTRIMFRVALAVAQHLFAERVRCGTFFCE
ncbi:hypothetical protein EKTHUN627_20240 [Enterobacter kobei]|nr:hypothetical protein EKTHUN627_20240 [Enterobacter kobei]